jgi:hypothetical protein
VQMTSLEREGASGITVKQAATALEAAFPAGLEALGLS